MHFSHDCNKKQSTKLKRIKKSTNVDNDKPVQTLTRIWFLALHPKSLIVYVSVAQHAAQINSGMTSLTHSYHVADGGESTQ